MRPTPKGWDQTAESLYPQPNIHNLRFAVAPISQIDHLPSPRRRHSGLDRRVRLLTRFDALEEILHMVDGPVAEAVCLHNRILSARHAFVIHAKPAPVELHGRLSAAELQPTVVDRGSHHALVDHIKAR